MILALALSCSPPGLASDGAADQTVMLCNSRQVVGQTAIGLAPTDVVRLFRVANVSFLGER